MVGSPDAKKRTSGPVKAAKPVPENPQKPLITRYRPKTWDEVVGNRGAVASMRSALERGDAQSFLLVGQAGVGKTSLARIAATAAGCLPADIREIDAATYTGIGNMRGIQDSLHYIPFGPSPKRALIVDECGSLSKQAWESLLKITEEPPEHVLWFLCTTEVAKVPATIKTRFHQVVLKPVKDDDMFDLLDRVCAEEGIQLVEGVDDLIMREAKGSPRLMLTHLSLCRDAPDMATAASLLQTAIVSDAALALCRLLASGEATWQKTMALVRKFESENPESIRIMVSNYFAVAAKGADTPSRAGNFLAILDAFSTPYNQSDGQAPLLLSLGRLLLADGR